MRWSWWRELGLFPRLAGMVAAGSVLLLVVLAAVGLRAVSTSTDRVLEERMVLAEMAAGQIDALIGQAFNELGKATTFARFDPTAAFLSEEYHLLAHTYGRVGTIALGVYMLDRKGNVVLAQPEAARTSEEALSAIRASLAGGARTVSRPFTDSNTGHPAVAVTVAIRDDDGAVISYLSGLLDLSGSAITEALEQARKLGVTGHAELVTAEGIVLASTDPGAFLKKGEHAEFYRASLSATRQNEIRSVPYEVDGTPTGAMHIMALAPLTNVDWGFGLGGDSAETLAPVASLRRNILFSSLVMLVMTLGITLWGARLFVRPVSALTERARGIAAGDLASPVHINASGEIGVLQRAFEDMRQRVLDSQDRLRQWNVELEDKVRERSRELAELNAMVEVERLRSEFISQVSHELRTPLGLIKGYITTLLRADVTPDEETRREFLVVVREETEKLVELVEALLDTSRVRSGTFAVNKEAVDLEALLQRVLERPSAGSPMHAVVRQGASPLPVITADPRRLEQVFSNLLDNAFKYSPGGQVTVEASTADGWVQFTVADQGEGIPPEELSVIFDAFYRGKSAVGRNSKGSGLGLTICRGIVEGHGGRIWAESSPGKGSRFHFTLPASGANDGQANTDS